MEGQGEKRGKKKEKAKLTFFNWAGAEATSVSKLV